MRTDMTPKETLYGKNPDELAALCAAEGMPRFAARQIARWLYVRHTEEPQRMTDLSAASRARLAKRFTTALHAPERVTVSADGTKKYLFRTAQGHFIESAYIPDGERATLCVSSQAGCRMGCRFCATGRQGLQHSLSAAEILNQIVSLPERDRLTNVVFMGMGEPLDNLDNVLRALGIMTADWGFAWSPTRITLSTAGVAPALRRFLDETKVHLAVSLHNPVHEERAEIMPVERAWPIAEVVDILRGYDFTHQRRVTRRATSARCAACSTASSAASTSSASTRFPDRPTSRPRTRRLSASATRSRPKASRRRSAPRAARTSRPPAGC